MVTLGGRLSRVPLPLLTARLSLRLFREDDAPLLARQINEPGVLTGLELRPGRYSESDEVRMVRAGRRAASKGERLPLAVTLKSTGELIGGVGLDLRGGAPHQGSLGYWLEPRYWHRGYGTETVEIVCCTGLRTLKLHRIEATVFDSNPRSMALLLRLGFQSEGHRREVRYRRGRWEGEVCFGLLAKELRPQSLRPTARGKPRPDGGPTPQDPS